MTAFSTNDPLEFMFRAVPVGTIELDLNRQDDEVVFRHAGCSTGTIQITSVGGGSTSNWVVTVERSNMPSGGWVARSTPLTYSNSFGVQAAISLDTEYTRVRVSTVEGSDATATVTMFARA